MKTKVLLLGANGMLGSMLLDVLSQESEFVLFATVRNSQLLRHLQKKYPSVIFVSFDAEKDLITKLLAKTKDVDWIINAIGIIKPFIHDDSVVEVQRAITVNAAFPFTIRDAIQRKKTRVIQIATDCVYSGEKGKYTESDAHDCLDVYGKTKSLGEVPSQEFHHIRCSIIGPEQETKKSLLEWFLHQENGALLSGFTNHMWNGITTLHFARLCVGIIKNDMKLGTLQHIIPANEVTKASLLQLFADVFDRQDITITKTKAKTSVNRTLHTLHDTINRQLWKHAGYKKPPTIEKMVMELAEYMKGKTI